MNDSETVEKFRHILFHGTDSEFRTYLLGLNSAGLSNADAYRLLLLIWEQLDHVANEKELDRLANWLDEVTRE